MQRERGVEGSQHGRKCQTAEDAATEVGLEEEGFIEVWRRPCFVVLVAEEGRLFGIGLSIVGGIFYRPREVTVRKLCIVEGRVKAFSASVNVFVLASLVLAVTLQH